MHSGANFTVCSARTLGLVVIHIAVPSIYAFDSLCSCENWKCVLLSQNVISSFRRPNCVRQVQLETVQGCLHMKASQQLEKHYRQHWDRSPIDAKVSVSCPQTVPLRHRSAYPVHKQSHWCTGQHFPSTKSPNVAQVSISCPQAVPLLHRSSYPLHKQPRCCTGQLILSTNSPTVAQVIISCPQTFPLLHRSSYPEG